MATGFDPLESSRSGNSQAQHGDPGPDLYGLSDLLEVVRLACRAEQASVVALDEDTRHTVVVAGAAGIKDIRIDYAEVDTLLLGSDIVDPALFDFGQSKSRKSTVIKALDCLILRLATRGRQRFFLLLRFEDELAMSRAGNAPSLPKMAQALARMVDTETRWLASERERMAAAAALNQAQCGVIAATAEGRPVIVNEAASALIAREEWLHLRRGMIRPIHHADAVRFQAALDTAAPDPKWHDAAARPAAILLLRPRSPHQQPIVVTVSPAGAPKAVGRDDEDAVVIIHLAQPDVDTTEGLEPVCELLGLSRVETRLVQQLHRGSTLTEAAAAMRIKVDTARGYLKQIFSKTDTHRQADLLALMTRHLRAVGGRFSFRPI